MVEVHKLREELAKLLSMRLVLTTWALITHIVSLLMMVFRIRFHATSRRESLYITSWVHNFTDIEDLFFIFVTWVTTILLGDIMKIIMAHFLNHAMWRMLSHVVPLCFKDFFCTTYVDDWSLDSKIFVSTFTYLNYWRSRFHIWRCPYSRCSSYPYIWSSITTLLSQGSLFLFVRFIAFKLFPCIQWGHCM